MAQVGLCRAEPPQLGGELCRAPRFRPRRGFERRLVPPCRRDCEADALPPAAPPNPTSRALAWRTRGSGRAGPCSQLARLASPRADTAPRARAGSPPPLRPRTTARRVPGRSRIPPRVTAATGRGQELLERDDRELADELIRVAADEDDEAAETRPPRACSTSAEAVRWSPPAPRLRDDPAPPPPPARRPARPRARSAPAARRARTAPGPRAAAPRVRPAALAARPRVPRRSAPASASCVSDLFDHRLPEPRTELGDRLATELEPLAAARSR